MATPPRQIRIPRRPKEPPWLAWTGGIVGRMVDGHRRWTWRGGIARLRVRLGKLGQAAEELVAPEHRQYIVSARRHALLIVALGALSASLASDESQRRSAITLYGYVDKVLAVAATLPLGETGWREDASASLTAAALQSGSTWGPMFARMVSSERPLVRLRPVDAEVRFAALIDSTEACGVAVYRIAGARGTPTDVAASAVSHADAGGDGAAGASRATPLEALAVVVGERLAERRVGFENAFVLRFRECEALPGAPDALVTVGHRQGDDARTVVLDDGVYRRLGFLWIWYIVRERTTLEDAPDRDEVRRTLFGSYLTDAQLERLDADAYPFLKAVDTKDLELALMAFAREQAGGTYILAERHEALQAILSRRSEPAGLWGFRFERRVATRLAPLVLLVLCFSFWHRVRRINPAGDLRTEPWIVLAPRGVAEGLGAVVWALLTVGAVAAVAWATWVYEFQEELTIPAESRQQRAAGEEVPCWRVWVSVIAAPRVWGTGAAMVALAFLLFAWNRVCWIAKEARRITAGRAGSAPS